MATRKTGTEKGESLEGPKRIAVNRKSVDEVPLDYANFCSISGTPEEVILEFGITHVPNKDEANINNRIVMNYQNAARLVAAMTEIIRRRGANAAQADPKAPEGLRSFNPAGPEGKEIQ